LLIDKSQLANNDSMGGNYNGSEIIPLLLTHGANINARDHEGDTVLHRICKENSYRAEDSMRILLRSGADVNAQNVLGQTCLYYFSLRDNNAKDESVKILNAFIDAGANLELHDLKGRTILHYALETPGGISELLLEQSQVPSISARTKYKGKSVLHIACRFLQPWKVVHQLINLGADPLWVDNKGNTVLHEVAARFDDTEEDAALLKEVIKRGVSIHTTNFRGQTVAHKLQSKSKNHQCHRNKHRQERNLITTLFQLDSSFDFNAADMDGNTPLHVAASTSEHHTFALIQAGADVNAKSFKLESPLHCAARGRQPGIISMILHLSTERGLNVNIDAQDESGRTPLHYACKSGRPESVQILISAGADVHKVDESRATMLMVCAEYEDEKARWNYLLTDGYSKKRAINTSRNGGIYGYMISKPIPRVDDLETHRIGVIAQMLMEAGVTQDGAPEAARAAKSSELLIALRPSDRTKWRSFSDGMLFLPYDEFGRVLSNYDIDGPTTDVASFIPGLDEAAIDELLARDVDFTKFSGYACDGYSTPMGKIARLGLTEHMRKLIKKIKEHEDPSHMRTDEEKAHFQLKSIPLLQTACLRRMWNMDMVRLLVEDGKVNVNEKEQTEDRSNYLDVKIVLGKTALHVLAEGNYWWHVEAIKYLVDKGMFFWN
jgi:ankyrin repeat protein